MRFWSKKVFKFYYRSYGNTYICKFAICRSWDTAEEYCWKSGASKFELHSDNENIVKGWENDEETIKLLDWNKYRHEYYAFSLD